MKTKNMVSVSLFAVLTAAGALIVVPVPFSPVPITLQTMFTILAGAILGKKLGMFSQLVYILMGVAGLPVFSKGGSGIGVLFGPTGGYIIGFVLAAYVCGLLVEKGYDLIGMVSGIVLIYITGIIQLKYVLGLIWLKAFAVGVFPFIPGAVIKIVIALAVYRKLKKTGIPGTVL
ncbi:MAG: biotin transporter BioY [Elusimicrobiota bacterium]